MIEIHKARAHLSQAYLHDLVHHREEAQEVHPPPLLSSSPFCTHQKGFFLAVETVFEVITSCPSIRMSLVVQQDSSGGGSKLNLIRELHNVLMECEVNDRGWNLVNGAKDPVIGTNENMYTNIYDVLRV